MSLEVAGISAALAAYVAIVTALLNRLRKRKIDERKYEKEMKCATFQSYILQSITNNVVKNISDIHNIYLANFEENTIVQSDHDEISLNLRKVLMNVSSDSRLPDERRNSYVELLKQLISQSDKLSEEGSQTIPFSNAPSPERGLLTDILELAGKNSDIARNKLKELAHAITVRQETIQQLSEEKGKSLKWAKWGVFGTVFFSAVSIALTIFK